MAINVILALACSVWQSADGQSPGGALERDKQRIHSLKLEMERYSSDLREPEIFHVAIELTRELLSELETDHYRQRVYLSLGDMEKNISDTAEAERFYELGIEIDEDGPYARSLRIKLAALLRETGRFQEAASDLKSPSAVIPVTPAGSRRTPVDMSDLFELRDHAKSAALAKDLETAINDFRIGMARYPTKSNELAGIATIVAESVSTRPGQGKAVTEQFYSQLVKEFPSLLDSEVLSSNIIVSAKRLQLRALLVQRIEMFVKRFPENQNVANFLVWAAEASEDRDRETYLRRAMEHKPASAELSRSLGDALSSLPKLPDKKALVKNDTGRRTWVLVLVFSNLFLMSFAAIWLFVKRFR